MDVNPHINIRYCDPIEHQGFIDTVINQHRYDRLKNLISTHLPAHKVQDTLAVYWDMCKHATELAIGKLPKLHKDVDTTYKTWMDGTKYPAAVKRKFDTARFNIDNIKAELRKICKAFIKAESYPEFKLDRPIKSTTDEMKTLIGAMFQLINDHLFELREFFIKKYPVEDRAKVLAETLDMMMDILCTDFSAFESHFIDFVMFSIETPMYMWISSDLPKASIWLILIEFMMEIRTCKFKDFVLHSMSRASGEMNTSSGNGWSNLVLYTYVARVKGATEHKGKFEGDDAITTTKPNRCSPTTQDFKDLGWICKLEKHTKFEEASFCGIVADLDDLDNVTDVKQYVCEFGWTKQQYLRANDTTIRALIRAKGYSAIYQYPGCPIILALGHYALRITNDDPAIAKLNKMIEKGTVMDSRYKSIKFQELLERHKMTIPARKEIKPNTRALVEKLYDIPIQEQIKIEEYLDNKNDISPLVFSMSSIPEVWEWTWENFVSDQIEAVVTPHKQIEEFRIWARNIPNITLEI